MTRCPPHQGRRESGVALAVVVWFIAGMSLLVAGVVLSARTDVRLAQIHLGRAQAAAAGDGAVNLLLADMIDARFESEPGAPFQQRYRLGDVWVAVTAVPLEWTLDPNYASAPRLADALEMAGAGSGESARVLADAVVQWRTGEPGMPARRFRATEDLLRVQGMNRAGWDLLRDYVAALPGQSRRGGLGDDATSFLPMLAAVAPARRAANAGGLALGSFTRGQSASNTYRLDALVEIGDSRWLRRRWVALRGSRGNYPWRVLRREPPRMVAGPLP